MRKGTSTHELAVMGAIGTCDIPLDTLSGKLPLSRSDVMIASSRLLRRGFIERREAGMYRLSEAGQKLLAEGAPLSRMTVQPRTSLLLRDTLQQRAWTAMRLTRRFSVGDIVVLACRNNDPNAVSNLQRFFRQLASAGYLAELPSKIKTDGAGRKQWVLMRDTGEAVPTWSNAKGGWTDQNTREVFPCV